MPITVAVDSALVIGIFSHLAAIKRLCCCRLLSDSGFECALYSLLQRLPFRLQPLDNTEAADIRWNLLSVEVSRFMSTVSQDNSTPSNKYLFRKNEYLS